MAEYENLIIDRVGTDERVGRITLSRPEKMNALSQELLYEFNDALHEMEADHSIRVIIVRGDGWQKDTLPSRYLRTGLNAPGNGRPSYENCVKTD